MTLKVGFGRADISPGLGAPMMGQLIAYPNKGVESRLFALAVALDDGTTHVLLIVCDLLLVCNADAVMYQAAVAEALGKPENLHVIISATHTHSGPSTMEVFGQEKNEGYSPKAGIVAAARHAWHTRQVSGLRWSQGECAGYGFNRRFVMVDGTVQTHPLKLDPQILQKEGPYSSALHVLTTTGVDEVMTGAVVLFGCHATVMPRESEFISADFPGRVREFVSARLVGDASSASSPPSKRQKAQPADVTVEGPYVSVLYLQAACGNICQCNPLNGCSCEVGTAHCQVMGAGIGSKVLELVTSASTTTRCVGQLHVAKTVLRLQRRPIMPELLLWAKRHEEERKVRAAAGEAAPSPPPQSDYGTELFNSGATALEVLFRSPWWADFYARELLTLIKAAEQEPLVPFEIVAVAQGCCWAIVNLPCELFVEFSERICAGSPFEHTAVNTLAGGYNGYIATREAFLRPGGYETKHLTSSFLDTDAGDAVVSESLQLLRDVYRTANARTL